MKDLVGEKKSASERGERETGAVSCEVHEGGRKIWKDDKEMAQHLRLEALLTVPPSLPLLLIITVLASFSPSVRLQTGCRCRRRQEYLCA